MAAKTVARTRTNRTVKSTSTTERKAPQPIANRYRGKCAECGEWVGAGEGVATPPASKGEKWSTHHGHIADNESAVIGPCPKPATVKNRRNNEKKEEANMAVRRPRKSAAKKPVETFSAEDIAALTLRELRDLAKELGLDEQMKKIEILNEMIAKGHLADSEDEESTPAPAKKTTPRKRAAAKESASAEDEEPQDDENDEVASALSEMLEVIKGQISSGALDVILGDIDDAITARLDAVAEEQKPARKSPAKKTTPAKSRSEKMAPMKRGTATQKPQEAPESEDATPEVGKIYTIGGRSALKGARVKFTQYKEGSSDRVIVVLTKAHGDRPRGAKISVPVTYIV